MSTFLIEKIGALLLEPISLTLLCHGFGLVALASGRWRTGIGCWVLGVALLYTCASSGFASWTGGGLEGLHPPLPVEASPNADVILVLGGGMEPALPPRVKADLGGAADRVVHAARLYHAGKAPLIIVSGGSMPWWADSPTGAASMAAFLEELGVPRDSIELEPQSRNTYENCRKTRALLDARSVEHVLLVTSALHMRRALATCLAQGIPAVPSATDYETVASGGPGRWLPSATAMDRTTRALKELVGYEVYRLRGWLDDSTVEPQR